jgi:hypothetical protein
LTVAHTLWGKSPKFKDSERREAAETLLRDPFKRRGEGIWERDDFSWAITDDLVKSLLERHPGESRGPDVVPTKVGNHLIDWIPVFTGNPGFRLSPE